MKNKTTLLLAAIFLLLSSYSTSFSQELFKLSENREIIMEEWKFELQVETNVRNPKKPKFALLEKGIAVLSQDRSTVT